MDFKIIWSDAAIEDLRDACAYIADHDLEAAHRVGKEILDHVRVLGSFPFIGPHYPRGTRGSLREIVCGSYRIFYGVSVNSGTIEILHVWHGARDEPSF